MADLFAEVTSFITTWSIESEYQLSDAADTFSSTYTILVTLLIGTILTAGNFILSPISCHSPVTFDGTNFDGFIDNYCWLEGSLVLKGKEIEEKFPNTKEMWEKMYDASRINFYPWVPLIVYGFSLISFFVFLMWRVTYRFGTEVDIQGLLDLAERARTENGEDRETSTRHMAILIREMISARCEQRRNRGRMSRTLAHWWKISLGRFVDRLETSPLSAWYLGSKLVFLASHICVLLFMHHVLQLGEEYRFFGVKVLSNVLRGIYWDQSGLFPRVTFCRVPIRHGVRVNHVYAQCVLPINMLNEVVFVILWFWYVAACLFMLLSIALWFSRSLSVGSAARFMKKLLLQAEIIPARSKWRHVHGERVFLRNFLLADGIFVLRMIDRNAGCNIAAEVAKELWAMFSKIDSGEELPLPTAWNRRTAPTPSSSVESCDSDDREEFVLLRNSNEQSTLDKRS